MAGNLRSPRKRAEEIGVESGNFHKDAPYDPSAGVPSEHVGGTYKDSADGGGPKPGGAADPSPFSNLRDG